jgi:hypothetical protein
MGVTFGETFPQFTQQQMFHLPTSLHEKKKAREEKLQNTNRQFESQSITNSSSGSQSRKTGSSCRLQSA